MTTVETYYALSENGAQIKYDPYKYFLGWDNFGWEITLPVAISNVQEIDFSVMSGVTLKNPTLRFDGALRVFAYDESNNVVGNVSSSVINRSTELDISSVLGPMYVGGNVVKTIRLLGPSNSGPNLVFNGVQDGITSYKVVTIEPVPISVTARPINILVSIDHEVTGATGYNITYQAQTGGEVTAVSGATTLQHNITGLVPETSYTIRMYADSGSGYTLRGELVTTTLPDVATNYDVSDFEDDSGVIDLVSLDATTATVMSNALPELLSTGDVVRLSTPSNPIASASFVSQGEAISLPSVTGLLLPFTPSSGSGQSVALTLSDNTTSSPILYDEVEASLTVESVTYTSGDTIYLDGYELSVSEYYSLFTVSVTEAPSLVVGPRAINIRVDISKEPLGSLGYKITSTGPSGVETTIVPDPDNTGHNIVGLTAETTYTVRLYVDYGPGYVLTDQVSTATLPNIPSNHDTDYLVKDGVIDMTSLPEDTISDMSGVMNELFQTGDKINVSLTRNTDLKTSFVALGGEFNTRDVLNSGVLLPFVETTGSDQGAGAVLSDGTTVPIDYNDTNNSITVSGVTYVVGDTFIFDGLKVTVTDLG